MKDYRHSGILMSSIPNNNNSNNNQPLPSQLATGTVLELFSMPFLYSDSPQGAHNNIFLLLSLPTPFYRMKH
jgi:hypothetical protein